jgi:diamine N-acetyltransferase
MKDKMNIYLEATDEKDINFVVQLECEKENKLYVGQWNEKQHLASLSNSDIEHFIIKKRSNKEPIGYIILAGLQNVNRSIELMRITIKEKGKGFGSQALSLIKEFAFAEQKANRLWLDVRIHNNRGRYLYKKEGFIEEGILRDAVKIEDKFESLAIMSILKKEVNL